MVNPCSFCRDLVIQAWWRFRTEAVLQGLSDRYLADMGLERAEIERYVAEAFPWPALHSDRLPCPMPSPLGCG